MKKLFSAAAITSVLLLAMFIVVTGTLNPREAQAATPRIAQIEEVKGDVTIRKSGGARTLTAYRFMDLSQGDRISTGPNSSAVLTVPDREDEIMIGANTDLYISDLRDEEGEPITGLKIWSGSVYHNVSPLGESQGTWKVETPTGVMEVRGTHFLLTVDPATGLPTLMVSAGKVAVAGGEGVTPSADVFPAQQITLHDHPANEGQPEPAYIDPDEIVNLADPTVIEELLRNKAEIDEENDRQFSEGNPPDEESVPEPYLVEEDELERYRQNVDNAWDILLNNAVDKGVINEDDLQSIIEQANEAISGTGEVDKEVPGDYDRNVKDFQLSDEEKRQRELARQRAEERKRQHELQKQQKQEQIAERNKELMNEIQQMRNVQNQKNQQAARDKEQEARNRWQQEIEQERLEQMIREREELQQREQPPAAEAPASGGSSYDDDDSDSGDNDDGGSNTGNTAPAAKDGLDFSLLLGETRTLHVDELAEDADGDPLTIGQITVSSLDYVEAVLTGSNELTVRAVGEGEAEITVEVSDGTAATNVVLKVTTLDNPQPIMRQGLDQVMEVGDRLTLSPELFAVDDQPLTFNSVSVTDNVYATAAIDEGTNELIIEALEPGITEILVSVSDGQNVVEQGFQVSVYEEAVKVSGTVSLPEGATAPAGGIPVYVQLVNENELHTLLAELDYVLQYSEPLFIPEGQNSVDYTLAVPAQEIDGFYTLRLHIEPFELSGTNYIRDAFYAYDGSSVDWGEIAHYVDYDGGINLNEGADGINLSLLTGTVLSGELMLPGPASGEMEFAIIAESSGYATNFFSTKVRVNEGEDTALFEIVVAPWATYYLQYNDKQSYHYYSQDGEPIPIEPTDEEYPDPIQLIWPNEVYY